MRGWYDEIGYILTLLSANTLAINKGYVEVFTVNPLKTQFVPRSKHFSSRL